MGPGMIANNIDHGGIAPAGIMQIGQTIAGAGAEMQQGAGRLARHARIAIGRARSDPFEQAEHRLHPLDPVERGHHVHFRGARIGETGVDALVDQSAHEAFGCKHGRSLRS